MTKEERNYIIEYYENKIWLPSMPKSNTLDDDYLNELRQTTDFAMWMLIINMKHA